MDMTIIDQMKPSINLPAIRPGDTVRVSLKVKEGDKERVEHFQGVVIKLRRGGIGGSFTVRRVSYGIGVERTFPLYLPIIQKVEVIRRGKVRRARLYYLRGLSSKAARLKERAEKSEETAGKAEAEVKAEGKAEE